MNVASLSLCKELYELSGWGETEKSYAYIHNMIGEFLRIDVTTEPHEFIAPAYDLGYLLRKLQVSDGWVYGRFYLEHYQVGDIRMWAVSYTSLSPRIPVIIDDTPEDAAAKLAIELFKQGILTKGEQ